MIYAACYFSFVDLDTPLLLSEDPVYGGYEGISYHLIICQFLVVSHIVLSFSFPCMLIYCQVIQLNTQFYITILFFLFLSACGPVYKFTNSRGHGSFLHWNNIAWLAFFSFIFFSTCFRDFNIYSLCLGVKFYFLKLTSRVMLRYCA